MILRWPQRFSNRYNTCNIVNKAFVIPFYIIAVLPQCMICWICKSRNGGVNSENIIIYRLINNIISSSGHGVIQLSVLRI